MLRIQLGVDLDGIEGIYILLSISGGAVFIPIAWWHATVRRTRVYLNSHGLRSALVPPASEEQ